MLYWILQVTIMSFLLIFLVHHLINFLKDTLTIPKVKDLVNVPTKKYDEIYDILNNKTRTLNSDEINGFNDFKDLDFDSVMNTSTSINSIDFGKSNMFDNYLPSSNVNDMKKDLKNFLKSQFNK